LQFNLVKRWLDDALRVETEAPLASNAWQHVLIAYDGSRLASGVQIFVDGKPQKLKVVLDLLNQPFAPKEEPFRIGGGNGPDGRFHGLIDDVRVYGSVLAADEAQVLATAEPIGALREIPTQQRSAPHAAKLRACFLERAAPPAIGKAHD